MSDEELANLRSQIEAESAVAELGLTKDYGHAAVLAKQLIGKYRWAVHRGAWMRWTGRVWEKIEEPRMAKIAADTLRKLYSARMNRLLTKSELADLAKLINETCYYGRIIGALNFFKGWERVLTLINEWDLFDQDKTAWRGIVRVDAQSSWDETLTPANGSTLSPVVTLGAR